MEETESKEQPTRCIQIEQVPSKGTAMVIKPQDQPEPGPHEAVVRVAASSISFTDTLMRRGLYPTKPKPPYSPGYDCVGVVAAVGAKVKDVKVGDRVADLTVYGANADFVVRPAKGLVPVPTGLDAGEATASVLSYLTAWQCLKRIGKPMPEGGSVLVVGANGAVGSALIRLGLGLGFKMFGTASAKHHDSLRLLGAPGTRQDGPCN